MRRQVTCDVSWSWSKIKDPCTTVVEQVMKNKLMAWTSRFLQELKQSTNPLSWSEANNGGPYGDLYVVVNVEPSDRFERDGSNHLLS